MDEIGLLSIKLYKIFPTVCLILTAGGVTDSNLLSVAVETALKYRVNGGRWRV